MVSKQKLFVTFFSLCHWRQLELRISGAREKLIDEVQNPVTLSLQCTEPMENHQVWHLKIVKKSLALIYRLAKSQYSTVFFQLFRRK
jgi:hypothetical protein